MKKFLRRARGFFLSTAIVCLLAAHAKAATLTVSPSSVSNTYSGIVTLQVTGLTNGETVVIQKFLDANTNGAIDAPDLLVQQFNLTDGTNFVIGGVTNINVPGDTDTTAGQITATLNFQNGDFAQNIVGKYLFKLSSPVGHFSPIISSFSVTNSPYAQKITGNVVNSGTNVPNAVVILFGPPRNSNDHGPGNPLATAVADNSGSYTIQVPPGTYVPLAFKSNYVANFGTSPVLALNSSQTINTNLTLVNATESISGKVVDINSGAGIPGVFFGNGSSAGFIAIASTDTNGNFTERVTPGQWSIDDGPSGLVVHGYVGYDGKTNIDTTGGSVSGLTLGFSKANALFYGTVKDNSGNPLPEIDVSATDGSIYWTDGYSDANGNYVVGVLDIGMSWQVQVSNDSSPTNYLFSQGAYDFISSGQAVRQNFTAILATNHIIGHVQFNGTNVVGVQVYADATIGTNNYQAQMDTDANGNYSLNVANGDWTVNVYQCCNNDSLDSILGSGNYQPPSGQSVGITNNDGVANFTVQPCNGVQILTTNLPAGQEGVYYDTFLEASSCNNNFTWSFVSGTAPPGLSANFSTGEIYGTPTAAGTYDFTVQVNDGNGHTAQTNLSLYIAPPFQITTTSLPQGTNGVFYSQTLQASGAPAPYSWSLNGNSPFGLTLSTNGILSGTPSYSGTNTFTVWVTDSNNITVFTNLTLVINPAPASLQINTTFLPQGTNTLFYSQTLQASGGTPSYTWSIPGYSQDPPPNLTLSPGGVLSGTITTNPGTYYFDVEVDDSASGTAYQTLSLTVVNPPLPPLTITNTSLPGGTVGASYRAQLGANGGQSPYTWQLAIGSASLPAGLSLDSSGLISGAPTTVKTNTFKVQVTDGNFSVTNKVLSIAINGPPTISSPAFSNGEFQMTVNGSGGRNYTVQASTNLSSTNWSALLVTNPSSGSFLFADPNATNAMRFYRVLTGP